MKTRNALTFAAMLFASAALVCPSAFAQDKPSVQQTIVQLQNDWDHVQYQVAGKDEQMKGFKALEKEGDAAVAAYPDSAEVKIWTGIAYSSESGLIRGPSALPKVDHAKELFEAAMKIDDKALNGGAHTSLGLLYHKVPGWPIGFGSNEKAEQQYKLALAISPTDIDANYFYGDYLLDEDRYA